MRKAPISLQDLRRRLYVKAKAEPSWRFWGLYGHVCKRETLREAYRLAKANNGAPGIDGVTFAAVEAGGVEVFLDQLREELVERTYRPQRARKVEIPKGEGKMRLLSIPSIRDRVVQGALKLILEPIFEADFQPGSFGYRPKKSAQAAIGRVREAILQGKSYVIDFDLRSYFDTVRHHIVLGKVARRVNDAAVLWLLKLLLKASGKQGVPQGGVMTPRTQKITCLGRRLNHTGTGRRDSTKSGAGRRDRQRVANGDGDGVVADKNLLDQEAQDLLPLSYVECLGPCTQLAAKRRQRLCYL
jgi:RNA-directed DNA polymerase